MEFDAVLLAPRRQQMMEQKYWHDRTLSDDLLSCLKECPNKLALTAYRLESGEVKRFTYAELSGLADRVAAGLMNLGIGRNDVVACQLPNWWQFTVTYLACVRIGAVINPLMHIFRERELNFMLKHGEVKVAIVPQTFRGFDYEQMLESIKPNLPDLQHIVVVDGKGHNSFDALLCNPDLDAKAKDLSSVPGVGADDVTQLIYTSGTTGEPKGVMHSANTLMANIIPYAKRLDLNAQDVILMASPMAHQTGFMYGLMMPIMLKSSVVLQDIWDPKKCVEVIQAEKVSFTMASTPFLTDLTKAVVELNSPVPTLKTFLCAGAPIPGPLVEQARSKLGTKIISAWGMSENGAVTLIELNDPDERAFNSDGLGLPGVDLKVVDADGQELARHQIGKLFVRSCSNFGGYLKRPQWNNTDQDGWFDTGDLARMDDEGYIRITGRSKDVIIRGGENIPVVEIESLLYRHPALAMVAVVAYPDERLGERACAIVVTKPDHSFDFAEMKTYLNAQKMAQQYIPERLEVLTAMPTTPSGKIQKFKLREQLLEIIKHHA